MVGNICPLQRRQEHPPPPPKNSCRGHFLFANDAKCVQVSHVKFSLPLNGQLGWGKKRGFFSSFLHCLRFPLASERSS